MSRSSSRSRSRSYSPSRPPKTEKSEDEKSTKEPLVKEVPKNVQDENANNEKSIIDTKDRKLQDREVIILNQFLIRTFQYLFFIIEWNLKNFPYSIRNEFFSDPIIFFLRL